jgi:hypothetical protein
VAESYRLVRTSPEAFGAPASSGGGHAGDESAGSQAREGG